MYFSAVIIIFTIRLVYQSWRDTLRILIYFPLSFSQFIFFLFLYNSFPLFIKTSLLDFTWNTLQDTDLVQSLFLFFSQEFDVAEINIISVQHAIFNDHPWDGQRCYSLITISTLEHQLHTSHFILSRTRGQQLHSSRGMSILNYLSIE